MARAGASMPGGSTRSFGYFEPYPLVFDRGEGVYLWDVDGNRYVDFTYNGLSLIHGHAYPPVERALREAIGRGTAWPGASDHQIEFAEALRERIPTAERVRFTNTGTEATMLAVKLTRHATGRPLILKATGAYHGSYDDLEAGLYGIGELEGRTVLAEFGDPASFSAAFETHGDRIAAVLIEPMLFTFRIIPPPPGFLPKIQELARDAGALVVLDDCLMFRLAEAGSAEKYGLSPDLTCLGKWIGGGLPVGVVTGSEKVLGILDPRNPESLYHGGSFNGNPLGCLAGRITLEDYTSERIARIDAQGARLAAEVCKKAEAVGLPVEVSGDGSVVGVYVLDTAGEPDRALGGLLHRAAINHGVYFGHDGEFALATAFSEESLEEAIVGLSAAFEDLAAEISGKGA